MRNFQRDNRSGDRPDMHEATCSECGRRCEVPFRPTGDKPVYCSDCFASKRGERDQSNRRDDRRDDRRGDRREDRRDRKMYSAICDKCGNACQIPFQPTPGKPVFCDACFSKGDRGGSKGGDQIQQITAKLDKIMNALIEAKIIKPIKEAPAAKVSDKKPEVKSAKAEVKPAKTEAKKETAKKAPVKKAAKKKK